MPSKHLLVVGRNSRMREDFERFYEIHPDFPSFVHCCVTSPPYKKGYSWADIDDVAETLNEFLLGPIWLNFGDMTGQMGRAPDNAITFEQRGFNWKQTIIWAKHLNGKGQYTPNNSTQMFTGHHEYIYLMYPKQYSKFYAIDRYAVNVPFTDETNIKRWKSGRTYKDPGSIWFMPYETVNDAKDKLHPLRFPLELPTRCLEHTIMPKDGWVLDPWGGSGTTALAAKHLNRNSLTYECDPKMIEVIRERIPEMQVIE